MTPLAMLLVCSPAFADEGSDWPQWRGPNGTGETAAVAPVTTWDRETNVRWRTPLPEAGNSTPIVYGDAVFLTQPESEENRRSLLCLDLETGEERWRRGAAYDAKEPTHRTNPYCSASPVADEERVIAWFGSAGLICWDHAGEELWRRDLGKQTHQWGYGSSPILYGDLCILNFGPGAREFLLAVDKRTGETVWRVNALVDDEERALSGPENDGGANDFGRNDDRAERLRGSWSVPVLAEIPRPDGQPKDQLILTLPRRVASFDPASGERLWVCGGGAPLAYASPMIVGETVVALGGYRGAALAVNATGEGNVTATKRLWQTPKGGGWLGTGVTVDGTVYVADMGGTLHALDAETGETLWRTRTAGSTWSSVTRGGADRLFLLSKEGATTVFAPNKERFEEIAVNRLAESTNASVVIARNTLLLRTDEALWAIGRPDDSTAGAQ
ncbi:MAG: PQQ-binding-like beta-propeller repeat protein [Planctomycetota bacterium]